MIYDLTTRLDISVDRNLSLQKKADEYERWLEKWEKVCIDGTDSIGDFEFGELYEGAQQALQTYKNK